VPADKHTRKRGRSQQFHALTDSPDSSDALSFCEAIVQYEFKQDQISMGQGLQSVAPSWS